MGRFGREGQRRVVGRLDGLLLMKQLLLVVVLCRSMLRGAHHLLRRCAKPPQPTAALTMIATSWPLLCGLGNDTNLPAYFLSLECCQRDCQSPSKDSKKAGSLLRACPAVSNTNRAIEAAFICSRLTTVVVAPDHYQKLWLDSTETGVCEADLYELRRMNVKMIVVLGSS